jgi:ProQ/FINO family
MADALAEVVAVVHDGSWPIATFRCATEFGRYRGIADFGKRPLSRFMGSRPSRNDHRPLKIGIHEDLVARGIDRRAVRLGLSRYCGHTGYHHALVEGTTRIHLEGQPAGIVTL